jgi:GNAT superfamily N-acetyltransferase
MERAVNPQTGEVLFLVNNQWVPPSQVAKNDKGDSAYLVANQWQIVPNTQAPSGGSSVKPESTLSPEEQMMGAIGAASTQPQILPRLPGDQAEMRPYEPSFTDQLMELLPSNKAKAANEYAARKIAEEKGIPVSQVYKDVGGARPTFNPEGRTPIRAGVEAAKITAEELPKVPEAVAGTFLKAYRAGDIEAPTDAGMVDKAIAAMKPTDAKGKPDPNYEAFQGLGESLGFSIATMVASATAAAAGELAGPVTGVAAGMSASGAMAYRASKDDFLSRVRDKLNGESQKLYGTNISQEDWNKAKKEFDGAATEYGAWEAIPEAVSNAVFLKAFASPVKTGRGAAKMNNLIEKIGSQGVEQGTETMTALGQNAAERKAGLSDEDLSIADAFRQQFVQTLMIGGVMAGGMKAKEAGEKFYKDVVEPKVRPGSALAKAIQADIDAVAFNPEATRQAAVNALNPNRAQQEAVASPELAAAPRSAVFAPPPPEEPVEAIKPAAQKTAVEVNAPASESQDLDAMLREVLSATGSDINTVNMPKAPVAEEPVAPVETSKEQPASTKLVEEVLPETPAAKERPSTPEIYNAIIDGQQGNANKLPEETRKWMTQNGLIEDGSVTPLSQRLMDAVKQAEEAHKNSQNVENLEAIKRGEPMPTPKSMTMDQVDQVVDKFIESNKPKAKPAAETEAPEQTLKEQYDKAAKMNFMAGDAFRNKLINQEQLDKIRSDYESIKAKYQASIPKSELSPIQQEATDIADKLEALGLKPFADGMRTSIEKDQVKEQNLEFYRTKLKQEQAKAPKAEEGIERPSEKWDWAKFYGDDSKSLEKLKLFNSKAKPEIKQALQTLSESIQAVTDRLNDEGYTMYGPADLNAPKEIKDLRSQIQMRSAEGSLLINKFEALNKGFNRSKKTSNQENLDKAIADAKAGAAEAQKSLQRSIPEPEEVTGARESLAEANKRVQTLEGKSGSLWSALMGKLDPEEVREIFGPSPSLGEKKLQVTKKSGKRGTYITEMAANGTLDSFLPPAMRHESSRFDAAESAQYIKDAVANKDYLPHDVKAEIEDIYRGVEPLGDLIDEYLTIEEQNRELQIAADEQREADQAAEVVEPEDENRPAERGERPALELTTQTADELKAKQDEIDRLTKENERLAKEAEAKAKADEQAAEFTLTGSDREADVAAAQGQQDIFATPKDNKKEIADLKKEQKTLMLQIIKAGLEETPEQEARMAEIDKRLRELEGKPAIQKEEKPAAKQRGVEEIQNELQDLEDQLEDEFNKDKRKVLVSEISKLQGELIGAEARAKKATAEEPAEEPEAPKGTVATPDGAVLRYPLAVSLVGDGYKVLALDDPRTYKDKGGDPHRTFEKGSLRIAMTPQRVLFQNRNSVNVAFGNPDQVTLEAIMVDPGKRNKGLATQAMNDVIEAADKNEITLYLEPVPIVNISKNDFGLDRDQLVDFYSKFGFEFQEDSNKVMQRKPSAEVEVLPAEEPQAAGLIENEPYTFEGQFTEIGDEEQRTLITDQSSKLSDAQIGTLEGEYGAKNGSDEFFEALRKDVIAYVTEGAKAVHGKIRAIIRQVANGLLSVAIVFNPQFVSKPYTIAVPQYDVRTSEVIKDLPREAKSMSDAAKRAYGVIYPTLEAQLKEKNKLFIIADKQSGNTYMFQPDGSLLLQSKTLFGAAIGDFMKGDNEIVSNRITPAGLFDLGLRDAKRSEGEARTAGEYDFGKVFVLDKSYMGSHGPYSNTIMHSVWLHEDDAKKRLAALDKPGAEDSRYSFGCINVNKETFRNLVTNHLDQMDGAKIFIVPENGTNVMDFVNGKATYSEDIIRQRAEPLTKTTKVEKQRAAPKVEERTMAAKEEEGTNYFSIEPQTQTQAFKKWFGDSKVVDADGKPLVVYHGTNKDFDAFNPYAEKNTQGGERLRGTNAIFFSDNPELASAYAGVSKSPLTGQSFAYPAESAYGGNVMPVYLSMQNPMIVDAQGQMYTKVEPLIRDAKKNGHDGVIFKNVADQPGAAGSLQVTTHDAYVVFKPEQIKSATGNRGTFDESGNINMSLGDSLAKLVDQMADGLAEDEKKRSPSLKRQLKTYNRQRKAGKMSDEMYVMMSDAAIREDEENQLKQEPKDRERGYLHIQERMSAAVRRGEMTREAYDLANWFMKQNEALVDDLGISIKGKGPMGAGGFYNNLSRVITLIKEGGSDLTATHEILHHLERMMPAKIQAAIRKAWLTQLTKAQKSAKSPAEKLYFEALMNAHFGANNASLLNVPEGAGNEYAAARSNMEDSGKTGSLELAKQLLMMEFVPIEAYQYFNPSEFWAVNGSRIVLNRYNAVDRGLVNKLKNWLGELGQKIKSIFGLKSDASIIRALDSLSKSDGKFVTDEMLGQGEFLNIKQNFRGGEMPKATWAMKESSNFDDWAQIWQDNYRDLKNVQKIITQQIGKIDDRINAYRKETLNPGRESERAQEFLKYEVDPLVKEMLDKKVSNEELATYLHNRYAEERNEIINAKNKNPAVQDQGSGISTENARKYLKELPADRKQVLESLAKRIDDIVRGSQDILVESGQETKDTIDSWRKESPHYVPLKRDESELDFIVQTGSGNLGGYATSGKFGKEALGSTKTVKNILENIMLQRDRAIRRAESMRIGQALYGLAIKYPNPDFWMAINPDAIKDMDALVAEMEAMGLDPELIDNLLEQPKTATIAKSKGPEGETIRDVKYRVSRSYQNARNVFPVRINGQNRFVLLNPKSPEAMRMAAELKQLDAEKLGIFFGAASTLTNWFTSVNTQYNPAFGLVNILNDIQGALVNLSTTPLSGQQKLVTKNVLPALRGIARDIRKERKQTEKTPIKTEYDPEDVKPEDWTSLWRLFRNAGGKTGFRDQMVRQKMNVEWKGFVPSFSFEDEHAMVKAMEKLEQGPIRKKVEWWADAFSDFNDTLENTVRLAVFKVAYLDNNLSVEEAADIAKNITVNFNKRGAKTKKIRGLYGFFNASLQGTARYAITLAGPAGSAIVKTGLTMGAINAMWMFMAGFDDDDPPQFTKNKGFIIPTGGGDYFIWNLPPGLRAIPNTGRLLTEGMLISVGAMKSNRGLGGKIMDAGGVIVDAINPFGGGTLLQTIAPTFLDPAFALAENKDSFGRPIFKEDQALKPTPGWQRTRDTASTFSKGLSWFLNYVSSGGEEFSKGFLSPTGDQLDYLIGQAAGGIGREIKRTVDLGVNKYQGEETPAYRVPVANRFLGETKTDAATAARFYDNVKMLAEHQNIINGRIENKGDVAGYYKQNPMAKYAFAGDEFENDVNGINKSIRELQKQPDTKENRETIKKMKAARVQLMETLNGLVRKSQ